MKEYNQLPEWKNKSWPKKLGTKPFIHDTASLRKVQLGEWTEVGPFSVLAESEIGDYSYDAGNVSIIYTTVGKFSNIASHVRINPGNHPMHRPTLHHMTYRRELFGFGEDDEDFFNWRREDHCNVGHDTWIGHGVTIMAGVSVGTGAVVGSGAVVTKDVAPYDVVVGVPARPVKKRFDDKTIEALMDIAWWDWEREKLEKYFHLLYDMDTFLSEFGRK